MRNELYDMDYPIRISRYGLSDLEYPSMRNEGGLGKDGAAQLIVFLVWWGRNFDSR